jgi:glucose-6-phosphate 1-dehydrogenase
VATVEQDNPLTEGLERTPVHPTNLVIFGATGDLAQRKLLPAVYNLAHEGALPERFNMIGIARTDQPDEEYREFARGAIRKYSRRTPDDTVLTSLLERMRYVPGSFDEATTYDSIDKIADELDEEAGIPFNRVFYLATAPGFFETIAEALGHRGLDKCEGSDVRLVVEKPFGRDLASAKELNRALLSVFEERQIFRIDHYLGKETMQNMLVLRFGNGIFEPL